MPGPAPVYACLLEIVRNGAGATPKKETGLTELQGAEGEVQGRSEIAGQSLEETEEVRSP